MLVHFVKKKNWFLSSLGGIWEVAEIFISILCASITLGSGEPEEKYQTVLFFTQSSLQCFLFFLPKTKRERWFAYRFSHPTPPQKNSPHSLPKTHPLHNPILSFFLFPPHPTNPSRAPPSRTGFVFLVPPSVPRWLGEWFFPRPGFKLAHTPEKLAKGEDDGFWGGGLLHAYMQIDLTGGGGFKPKASFFSFSVAV